MSDIARVGCFEVEEQNSVVRRPRGKNMVHAGGKLNASVVTVSLCLPVTFAIGPPPCAPRAMILAGSHTDMEPSLSPLR